MQRMILRIEWSILLCVMTLTVPLALHAESDAAKVFEAKCVLCHAADGSGSSATGKALKAKDLRSDEVQKKSDAELTAVITKGHGKMPAFGEKLKPEQIPQLVAYIRQLAAK
jgi:mono/diheme cytochrome c family protein